MVTRTTAVAMAVATTGACVARGHAIGIGGVSTGDRAQVGTLAVLDGGDLVIAGCFRGRLAPGGGMVLDDGDGHGFVARLDREGVPGWARAHPGSCNRPPDLATLALVADERWQTRLRRARTTLLHGDLRRANIAFENDGVALLDWEFAATGPPACDIQWHVFLQYWAYPPGGMRPGDDGDDLRDFYLRAFEEAAGRRVDRAEFLDEWALGWIKVMASVGYVLYDSLHRHGGTPEARTEIGDLATRAVQRAIEAREALG
jgi:hypothetical protein